LKFTNKWKFLWRTNHFGLWTLYLTPWVGDMLIFLNSWLNSSQIWDGLRLSLFGDNLKAAARVIIRGELFTVIPRLLVCKLLLRESLNIITGEFFLSLSSKPNCELTGDWESVRCSLDASFDAVLHNEVMIIGKRMSRCEPFSATIYSKKIKLLLMQIIHSNLH
jgi:hypothetical protein